MTRRAARITHDDVRRMVKAVRSCGLSVGEVIFDGSNVRVVIGENNGGERKIVVDNPVDPANFQSLEEYLAWREAEDARAG